MSQITQTHKYNLLKLARKTIEEHLFKESNIELKLEDPIYQEEKGCFVTIHKKGNLRGCIGIVDAIYPVIKVVEQMAYSSAFRDPRFQPLTENEYPDIDIEISLLSKPYAIDSPDDIIIGKHGLIISYQGQKGLLLPQVATEHQWDVETFLNHTCLKASLPVDKWKKGANIEVFDAIVFGENE